MKRYEEISEPFFKMSCQSHVYNIDLNLQLCSRINIYIYFFVADFEDKFSRFSDGGLR